MRSAESEIAVSYALERRLMVDRQLAGRGIRDRRVLEAMGAIRRECFVPHDHSAEAYADAPIGIGHGQTISQPYMTALMCEELNLRGDEVVLDVGAGSGYHAAVLAALSAHVYALEVIPDLCEQARQNLAYAGMGDNITIVCCDGSEGYPGEVRHFDAISVAAAAPDIPAALLEQLGDPGKLVIPVGSREEQNLLVLTKRAGRIETRIATACRFVPLVGRQGFEG